ncbi:lipid-A-disaccharide synthase [Algiphilus sp.]|uniref:lipid-A-disaccharide synthase n=1 Tax=Algiphilus sp. TaxID=1872431 RepID=UPI0025C3F2BC|nr:lipid-A-disaccharide synthase [Algiphilus sp.]MCK5771891.1 lipid-A-disaccharide synthase [Algiphilus sp.]
MRVVLLAGEASGDLLGAAIARGLREAAPDIELTGITGPHMRAAGCESIADINALSLMGIFEIARELPRLIRFRRAVRDAIVALKPDIVVGIDAPDFNLGLEGMLRACGLRSVHVVSPTIWAWRAGRRFKIARNCDAILCLYPFEPACYADTGLRAEYIGHPLADELDASTAPRQARAALGLDPERPVLGVLPGSRHGEVARLMPDFAAAAARLAERHPGIRAVVPVAHEGLRDAIATHAVDAPGLEWTLVDGDSRQVMQASDLLLLASGTVTLEALLLGRPMVVAYRASAATIGLLRLFRLVRTDFFALPNVLTRERTVPELLQEQVSAEALATELEPLWADPDARRYQMRQFDAVRAELRCDAGKQAAAMLLDIAGRT